MRKLLVYLRDYRRESVLAPLFKLAESLMDLLVPLVIAAIINQGIGAGNMDMTLRCFVLLIVLAVLGMGFSFTAQWMAAKASVGFTTELRQALFDHIQGLSYKELDTLGTDTLITRMTSDVLQIQNGLNLALRLLLRSPFIVFGAMICAFAIDVRCALVFAVAIPLLALVVFGIILLSIPLFTKVQTVLDGLTGITRENLTGVRVIRAFGKERYEIDDSFDRAKPGPDKRVRAEWHRGQVLPPVRAWLEDAQGPVALRGRCDGDYWLPARCPQGLVSGVWLSGRAGVAFHASRSQQHHVRLRRGRAQTSADAHF